MDAKTPPWLAPPHQPSPLIEKATFEGKRRRPRGMVTTQGGCCGQRANCGTDQAVVTTKYNQPSLLYRTYCHLQVTYWCSTFCNSIFRCNHACFVSCLSVGLRYIPFQCQIVGGGTLSRFLLKYSSHSYMNTPALVVEQGFRKHIPLSVHLAGKPNPRWRVLGPHRYSP